MVDKTWILVRKAIQLMLLNPGEDLILTEPTGPMITTVLLPEIHQALEDFGLDYEFKVGERIFYIKANGYTSRMICLSMENYNRIRGQNVCAVLADEAATTKDEVLDSAINMFKARLRAGTVRQLVLVSTPENYGTLYKVAVKEAAKYKAKWIKASTMSNPFVPRAFIDDMLAIYTPEQIRSYVYGEFSNLQSGSVYDFDRLENHATIELDGNEQDIYVSCDFNAGACVTIFSLFIDNEIFVFDEWLTKNSFETRDRLIKEYPDKDLWCTADASGGYSTSVSDHEILREHPGLVVVQGQKNPSINESILAANAGFRNKKIWFDTDKVPKLTEAIEQIAYDPKTQKPMKSTIHEGGSKDDRSDVLRYKVHFLLPLQKPTFTTYNQN